jgi:predicted NBD/HSP70 family sugar kinase
MQHARIASMKLAVDIGGTKTLLASFDEAGILVDKVKFPTPPLYSDFLTSLASNVVKLSSPVFTAAVAAVPARIDRETGVGIAFGSLKWRDVPIQADLQIILHCPVRIENDTKLAGLSEALLTPEYNNVLYVTISTGISSAIIIDGKIDPHFADSETGQLLLEHQGQLMDWEDFASGSAIVKRFGQRVEDITDPQIWYAVARNIAIGLVDLIATLTPQLIILGGGVGAHYPKFKDRLLEELKIYENPLFAIPPIRQAVRPEEAVIYGCYELMRGSR